MKNSDTQAQISEESTATSRAWSEMIASACFAEELDLESLPLPESVKDSVRAVLGELSRLSPLEALSRCISNPSQPLPRK
jgi:hypothetical protein